MFVPNQAYGSAIQHTQSVIHNIPPPKKASIPFLAQ